MDVKEEESGHTISYVVGHVVFGWSCRLKNLEKLTFYWTCGKMIARKQELVMWLGP